MNKIINSTKITKHTDKKTYEPGLVSVIIPTYKRATTLARAINSVLFQTYTNIELLVVDDNEPNDEYSSRVNEIISTIKDKRIKLVLQKKHVNGAAARNAGIKVAQGEYLAFLDDDDFWSIDKIKIQVATLSALDSSFGGVSTKVMLLKNGRVYRISASYSSENQCEKILSRRIGISTPTVLLRHVALDETGYFDETLKRHQEVQLFSYFTRKYKIMQIKKNLTIVDLDDTANRPDAKKIIDFKEAFFKSVEPLLMELGEKKAKRIKALHSFEVALAYYRAGNKKGAIKIVICNIKDPLVLFYVIQRTIQRILGKLAARGARYPRHGFGMRKRI